MKTISSQKFIIDGKTYSSLDEIPTDIREQYAEALAQAARDSNGDGVPDIFEGQNVVKGPAPSLDEIKSMMTKEQIAAMGLDRGNWKESGLLKKSGSRDKTPTAEGEPLYSSSGSTMRNMLVVAALILLIYYFVHGFG